VTPGETQLPGSASDWQTVQSFLAVRGAESQIVQASDQAPLVQLGDFNLGKWMPVTRVGSPRVFSWVMNNYWFTNFRADQEGDFRWHYSVTSGADRTTTSATRFGWGARVPLAARVFPPAPGRTNALAWAYSPLSVQVTNLLMVEARPAPDGEGILAQVREIEGQQTSVRLQDLEVQVRLQKADEVDVLGRPVRENIDGLEFEAWETKFVRLVF
jgi:hypothetical protein